MNTAVAVRPNLGRRTIALAVVWLVAYFTARGILELDTLETWQRVTIALAPVPIFAGFLWTYIGVVRSMDELERKIHLEALGIAFSLALLLLTTLALMQRAITLSFENWSYAHVWFYLPAFYFVAIGFTSRRYQAEEDEA
jgi:hypothetical protein